MGFEIADLRGIGADYKGQMVVYLAGGSNPITEEAWATYTPDPGFLLNTPRQGQFDVLEVLGSPFQPTGTYTYITDTHGFTWQAVAAVDNRVYPFDADDYAGYSPPITSSAQAGFALTTPLPGTVQYNGNDKNHENTYYAEDGSGNPQLQHFVTDPWGNVYILKSVNAANDTPEKVAAAVDAAVLPEGWTKSSGYLDADTTYVPVWSGDVAHANEFRDSADSAWMQIEWGTSGYTLASKIGDGLEIWGGNTDDTVKGNAEGSVMHGGEGNDLVLGWRGKDTITGDLGKDELRGGRGSDALWGGKGDDTLKGGRGDDALAGGQGDDILKGGKGKDVFVFDDVKAGKDTIVDFVHGKDKIDLSALNGTAVAMIGGMTALSGDAIGDLSIERVSSETQFAGRKLLDGSLGFMIKGAVDTNGDGKPDTKFVIKVISQGMLDDSDIIL